MELTLAELPETLRHYTGKPVPKWMRVLAPDAAASILKLETEQGPLSYTDIWRSAEVSRLARATKRGVQPPGYSAHNYGLAVDFDIDGTMKLRKWSYAQMLAILEGYGWYCHRRDGASGKSESWHFNYLGAAVRKYLPLADPKRARTWAAPAEQLMADRYGKQMKLSAIEVQAALKSVRMYAGDLDGRLGPISKQGILAFQRAWGLAPTGLSDESFQRTLAFVTATRITALARL